MRIIVITPEQPHGDEPMLISEMLRRGVSRVHLRHPSLSHSELGDLIHEIPSGLRSRISLHDCFSLVAEYPEVGVNLNKRNPEAPDIPFGMLSRSCHSLEETRLPADYCLLSPIFPSISKPGYSRTFSSEELLAMPSDKVIAMGGITVERIDYLKRYPFIGAAFLGAVWSKDTNSAEVFENLAKILEIK